MRELSRPEEGGRSGQALASRRTRDGPQLQETRDVPERRVHACLTGPSGNGRGDQRGADIDLPKCAPSGVWNLELGHPLRCPKEEETEKKKTGSWNAGTEQEIDPF